MSNSSSSQKTRATMGHLVRRGIPLLVLIGVLVAAYLYLRNDQHAPQLDPLAAGPVDPVSVKVFTTREETVPLNLRFLGQTEASQVVEIRARVAGHIMERNFQEGEMVQEGQKLFQIDPRPIEVDLLQARAHEASAQAVLEQARISMERQQRLDQREATSQQELDEAQSAYQVALANLQLAKAQIAAAELELKYAEIASPVTGRIGQVLVDVGNYILAGGSQSLATIQKVDPIYVRFPITEREVLRFRQEVSDGGIVSPPTDELELEITLADDTVYPHLGRINFQDIKIDQSTGTMVVRGSVPNEEGHLIPGQFIHTTVLGPTRVNVIRIPQSAVIQSPVGASVYVVSSENVVEARPVRLGQWSGTDLWIIEEGLKAGERVITDRLMMLRPGVPVVANGSEETSATQTSTGQNSEQPETTEAP